MVQYWLQMMMMMAVWSYFVGLIDMTLVIMGTVALVGVVVVAVG